MSEPLLTIPNINSLPHRPFVQSLASRKSWVKVDFFGEQPPTKAEIYRTIEVLCLIYNGWDSDDDPPTVEPKEQK